MAQPIREKDPTVFLNLFAEVSKMRESMDLETPLEPTPDSKLGQVIGAIIIGSCSAPIESFEFRPGPKDLDVVFVVENKLNPRAQEFAETVGSEFDFKYSQLRERMELGRLDLLGLINLQGETSLPFLDEAIKQTPRTLVYAFTKPSTERINILVSKLKES